MISELTLPKHKVDEVAQDYQALYDIGLQHVQNLAQRIWTDYNVHDPGITTLELLCYALTDLSYRASFPIEDLLASEKDNAKEMEKQFFTARQILPNRPLTVADYRKLLIDLPGVKNAWLHLAIKTYYANMEKRELQWQNDSLPDTMPVKVAGLYDVLIEFMDNISSTIKDDTMKEVRRLLQANRNLCEDFVNISEVGTPQSFLLCAELELTPIADEAKVKAEILFQVQQYLAPPVDRYTLSEMLERKQADGTRYTADKIFEGPALYGGFIDDDELAKANLREEIRLSDIISIIMDVEGVQAVRDIVISPQNSPQGTQTLLENKWVVPVAPGQKAWIDEEGPSRLVFYKRNMRVEPNDDKVLAYYKQLTKAAKTEAETGAVYDFDIPLGQYRQPGQP